MADQNGKYDPGRAAIAKSIAKEAKDTQSSDFGDVTVGQLVGGLDKTYSDYRNLRIDVLQAIIVVVRSIQGASDDETEKFLALKRKQAATQ
jgi:hypothetical protein